MLGKNTELGCKYFVNKLWLLWFVFCLFSIFLVFIYSNYSCLFLVKTVDLRRESRGKTVYSSVNCNQDSKRLAPFLSQIAIRKRSKTIREKVSSIAYTAAVSMHYTQNVYVLVYYKRSESSVNTCTFHTHIDTTNYKLWNLNFEF